jgi:4-hydroxy-3-methylbut-2-enyl diphosphate reductase
LRELQKQGVEILDEPFMPSDLKGATVIIRAHGVAPNLEALLVGLGAELVDATCPRVKASQMKAKTFAEAGYRIFLAGEKQHGELIGIRGYAPNCLSVEDPSEARSAAETLYHTDPGGKTALLGQTTISAEEYHRIGAEILPYFPDIEIIDTICNATKDRQEALKKLCENADALVIAGGKESANTRRLLAIARNQNKPAWLVESPEDLPPEAGVYSAVGLSAGASTPDDLIDQIEKALYDLSVKV